MAGKMEENPDAKADKAMIHHEMMKVHGKRQPKMPMKAAAKKK